MSSTKAVVEQCCNGCSKSVQKIKKKYRGKKYCSTCYARIFVKRSCPSCHEFARLPKNDDQAICNDCIKKQPCIRCNQQEKDIVRITEYGVVCKSCSVYFKPFETCERCGASSQKLTHVSRFNDGLRVCPKCSTRDYETCPSCHKYRLLESDDLGHKKCKKCIEATYKTCLACDVEVVAGCGGFCDECYWKKNFKKKLERNKKLFENKFLIESFEQYTTWLIAEVGAKKAALYINKHTDFFIETEELWLDTIPTYSSLLGLLRANGLRKFELIMRWLYEIHNIQIDLTLKNSCSEIDQITNLIDSLSDIPFIYEILNNYKNKMLSKVKLGKTSVRSARLAMKPAVALMQVVHSFEPEVLLPIEAHVKAYLINNSGQAAALTGFINFLNDQYGTNIDYISFKKSNFLKKANKNKLEKELIGMMKSDIDFNLLAWVKKGLLFFHEMEYQDVLKIKLEMITAIEDGYNISYKRKIYWLPRVL